MTSEKLTSLTLALTAFNEGDALEATVRKALAFLPSVALSWELLIVDDGSSDATPEVAARLAREHAEIRVLTHMKNQGMGAAIRTAMEAAQKDWFCTIAADGQVDPNDLSVFVPEALQAQMVFSTYTNRRDGFDRWILSNGLRILIWLFTGIRKLPTGNYFIRTEILRRLNLRSKTFFLNFEIFLECLRQDANIKWVQIPCTVRNTGKTKVRNIKTILKVMKELLKYRF